MKLNTLLAALLCALAAWGGLPRLSWGAAPGYQVTLTAYTCEATPQNPMHPCGGLRWGGSVHAPGLACPADWRGRLLELPGYGTFRCDDTAASSFLNGLPHVDLRVPTLAQARQIGMRHATVYPVDALPDATPAPAPERDDAPEGAIQWASKLAPKGDIKTAMARLVRAKTAREHFATLLEPVAASPEQALWLVTLWVPPSHIPVGTVAQPNANSEVAAQFFVFDAASGELLTSVFISKDVLDTMGWLPSEAPALP